jgi:hypothetical protein
MDNRKTSSINEKNIDNYKYNITYKRRRQVKKTFDFLWFPITGYPLFKENYQLGRKKFKGDESIRHFKEDNNGVAAVIGTIMGLMVFLAFISLFVMHWVPVMMEDNEAKHMRTAKGQFSNLKETIDKQITDDNRNETMDTTIELGADGVPMFERETPGQLSLRLSSEFFNYSFQDNGQDIYENSSGSVDLISYNRFFVRQTLIYENGAVIIHQKQGDIVRNEPEFSVEKTGNQVNLRTTLVSLYHSNDDSVAGIGQESVSTRLWYTDRWTYGNITTPNERVTLTIVSEYSDAWSTYYDNILSIAGLINGDDYNITSASGTISVVIDRVSEFSLSHSFMEAYIGRATT